MSEPAPHDPLIGAVLSERYRVARKIGDGGFGAVYEGEHLLLKKRVAIKILHARHREDLELVGRFHREAQAASAIGHPHIVEVTDLGTSADGRPYMVLEHLEGHDWETELRGAGPQPIGRVVHILEQVLSALGAAHDKGIVHRDLKPANIFLTRFEEDDAFVKVLDFGISKMHTGPDGDRALTQTGVALGTPYYMSPEQCQGSRDVDHRSDIFAMGVMLFEALTGQRPFDADSYTALVMKVCTEPAPEIDRWRLDVPEPMRALVDRMLAKRPAERPSSCQEVRDALLPFASLDAAPVTAARPPTADEVRAAPVNLSERPGAPPATSRRSLVPALVALVALLVVALALVGWMAFARRGAGPVVVADQTPSVAPIEVAPIEGAETSEVAMRPLAPRDAAAARAEEPASSPPEVVVQGPEPSADEDAPSGSRARAPRTRTVMCGGTPRELPIFTQGELGIIGYAWTLGRASREEISTMRARANAQIAGKLTRCFRGHAFPEGQDWIISTRGANRPFGFRPHTYCAVEPAVASCVNQALGELAWPQPLEDGPMEFRISIARTNWRTQ